MLIGSSFPVEHGLPRSGRGYGRLDEVLQLHPRAVGLNHYCVLSITKDRVCARGREHSGGLALGLLFAQKRFLLESTKDHVA